MRVPVPRRTAITLVAAALVALAGCTGHGGSGYVGLARSAASDLETGGTDRARPARPRATAALRPSTTPSRRRSALTPG